MGRSTELSKDDVVQPPATTDLPLKSDSDRPAYAGMNSEARLSADYLEGVEAIASYLGWSARKVRYAREIGALLIRVKSGVGLYAFKSEILAALKTPDTLAPRSPNKAH
jgi:hypothetical protein